MIKKEKVYIQDIAKAPFIDRFCYCLFNYLRLDLSGKSYMVWNPLKWSLMTFLFSIYVAFIYLVLIPIIGLPIIAVDAYKMPSRYKSNEFKGCFQDDMYLLRELP